MKVPSHIYWSCREKATCDMQDPAQRVWWLAHVLTNGTMADIVSLDGNEVRDALPRLNLPRHVRALWRDYFEWRDSHAVSSEGA
jgi:hypothetical protein